MSNTAYRRDYSRRSGGRNIEGRRTDNRRNYNNRAGSRKVVKYKKRRHINVGIIVFATVLIYISIYIAVYITREKVNIYEVVMGKNASIINKSYTGLVLRNEYVVNADASGYLNYFLKEGDRVSKTSTVYTIDESGTINDILSNASESGAIVFEEKDELVLRDLISNYTANINDINFGNIYDFKADINSSILECINLNNIESLINSSSGGSFKVHIAETSGIVAYYNDGYETKKEESLSPSDFNMEEYKKASHTSGDLIESGTPVYKVVTDENWHIYFKLDDEDLERYRNTEVLKVKVLSDGRELSGDFSIIYIEGQAYGKLNMIRYMSSYVTFRFMELQIIDEQVKGLKIPKTSVVEKDFFTIPKEYAGRDSLTLATGFYKRVYDENQEEEIVFVTPTIYCVTDEYYYVDASDKSGLKEGDFAVMPDGSNNFRVGQKASLVGAYNVNSGYCIFRNVDILTETGDYYLVDVNTPYGLKVFDHIIIDGAMVSENQVVFSVD